MFSLSSIRRLNCRLLLVLVLPLPVELVSAGVVPVSVVVATGLACLFLCELILHLGTYENKDEVQTVPQKESKGGKKGKCKVRRVGFRCVFRLLCVGLSGWLLFSIETRRDATSGNVSRSIRTTRDG